MSDSVRSVTIRDCVIGGPELVVMAGPCAIESAEQIFDAAFEAGCLSFRKLD